MSMTKGEQFLWAVQTMFLSEQIKLAGSPETAGLHLGATYKHDITLGCAWSVSKLMDQDETYPEDMNAFDAAYELVQCAFDEEEELPPWARGFSEILQHERIGELSDRRSDRGAERQADDE